MLKEDSGSSSESDTHKDKLPGKENRVGVLHNVNRARNSEQVQEVQYLRVPFLSCEESESIQLGR